VSGRPNTDDLVAQQKRHKPIWELVQDRVRWGDGDDTDLPSVAGVRNLTERAVGLLPDAEPATAASDADVRAASVPLESTVVAEVRHSWSTPKMGSARLCG